MKDLLEIYRMSSYKTHGAVVHGSEKPEGAFLRGVGVFGRCGLRGREREITPPWATGAVYRSQGVTQSDRACPSCTKMTLGVDSDPAKCNHT